MSTPTQLSQETISEFLNPNEQTLKDFTNFITKDCEFMKLQIYKDFLKYKKIFLL
jgi:hypothetical protein